MEWRKFIALALGCIFSGNARLPLSASRRSWWRRRQARRWSSHNPAAPRRRTPPSSPPPRWGPPPTSSFSPPTCSTSWTYCSSAFCSSLSAKAKLSSCSELQVVQQGFRPCHLQSFFFAPPDFQNYQNEKRVTANHAKQLLVGWASFFLSFW